MYDSFYSDIDAVLQAQSGKPLKVRRHGARASSVAETTKHSAQ